MEPVNIYMIKREGTEKVVRNCWKKEEIKNNIVS
jgi:hypothetical protein